jgi:hypothetical protein
MAKYLQAIDAHCLNCGYRIDWKLLSSKLRKTESIEAGGKR